MVAVCGAAITKPSATVFARMIFVSLVFYFQEEWWSVPYWLYFL